MEAFEWGNVSENQKDLLDSITRRDTITSMRLLRTRRIQLNHSFIELALYICIKNQDVRMIKLLLRFIHNLVEVNLVHTFWVIFYENAIEIGNELINANIDVNLKGSNGRTILHLAVKSGNLCLVLQLIEKGANINESDD